MSYNALRLARNEISQIHEDAYLETANNMPWVTELKYNLSTSHPEIDICDSIANGGPNSDGVYPKDEYPGRQHVQCWCFPTAELMDKDEFLTQVRGWMQGENSFLDDYAAKFGPGGQPTLFSLPESDIKYLLKNGAIESTEELGGGVNESFIVKIRNDGRAVHKPEGGASTSVGYSFGHSVEQTTKNELAASYVGEVLGFDNIVPKVVARTINGEHGALMQFWENSRVGHSVIDRSEIGEKLVAADVRKATLFDVLIGNQDRHMGNFMVTNSTVSGQHGVRLIDHGFSFANQGDHLNNSTFINHYFGSNLAPEELSMLNKLGYVKMEAGTELVELSPDVNTQLSRLLSRDQLDSFKERLGWLLTKKKMSFPDTWDDWNERLGR